MNIYDVQKTLKKGINNTLHGAECNGKDCYCGANDDKQEMADTIKYLDKIKPAILVIELLNWPQSLWRHIEHMIRLRFDRADIPNIHTHNTDSKA